MIANKNAFHRIFLSWAAQGKILKCPWNLMENSGKLVSQKCGHPVSVRSLVSGRALQVLTVNSWKYEIIANHISYMKSFGFKEDNLSDKFPSFYWDPKLHKSPHKHCSIASSLNCTTKPLSVPLTRILSSIKRKLSNLSSDSHIQLYRYQRIVHFEKQLWIAAENE